MQKFREIEILRRLVKYQIKGSKLKNYKKFLITYSESGI